MKDFFIFVGFVLILSVITVLTPVAAHEGKTPIHYVSESGIDEGDCAIASSPCASIAYALKQVEKGDEIRVAGGWYPFVVGEPAEVVQLLSHVVRVSGSYDEKFIAQNVADSATILTGIDMTEAAALEARGILIAQAEAEAGVSTAAAQDQQSTLLSRGVSRYVTADGVSDGDCNATAPCALDHALTIAGEGDAVLIASGDYDIDPDTTELLLRPDITVRGGYLENIRFSAAAPNSEPSYISGPSFQQREALAARGLSLIQDQKGRVISDFVASAAARQTEPLAATPCDSGTGMAGPFPCKGIDLLAQLPLNRLSTQPGAANDIWGFVDKRDGREYAIMGLLNGTAVIDVTDPESPVEVGTIPGFEAIWRDVKVYQFRNENGVFQSYAYVTADNPSSPQGLQIIDLSGLPSSISLAGTYRGFNEAHNIYIANTDYATGEALPGHEPQAFILGSNLALGAAHGLSLADPLNPVENLRPIVNSQYAHDAASAIITDSRTAACQSGLTPPPGGHNPCELLIDYNENTLDLWDVTDPTKPLMLSSVTYENASYVHSGWVSEDTNFVFVQDELDEVEKGLNTTVRVFDISNLTAPALAGIWTGPETNIDHNGFVKGDKYYMSAYWRGLSILDITDPTSPTEIGFFDTFPTPSANLPQFNGAWGVYPFLPSGTILVSNIEDGLFVLKESAGPTEPEPEPDPESEIAFYEYPVKVVCGIEKSSEVGYLVQGRYGTVINIANLGDEALKLSKALSLTIPPGKQIPGKTAHIGDDALDATQALKTDCHDIGKRVFNGAPPALFEGFVLIRSNSPLTVQAVYSASNLNRGESFGGDVDIETIAARLVKK